MRGRQLDLIFSAARAYSTADGITVRGHFVPPKRFRPAYYYRRGGGKKPIERLTGKQFPTAADASGQGPRLYDYQVISEMVRSLPTASERIDFVNPYEREFTRREKRFHRPWQPKLYPQRKAWGVTSVPSYFDPLNFYQYITKTKVISGLDRWYDYDVEVSAEFKEAVEESLRCYIEMTNVDDEVDRTTRILRNLLDVTVDNAMATRMYPDLLKLRVSYNPRCESFWIRSGFGALYTNETNMKHRGDDRALLGELAFVLRDDVAAHIRSRTALKPLLSLDDEEVNAELFDKTVNVTDDIIYSPGVYNLCTDADPLWQCPGYEPDCGEPCQYGVVAFKHFNLLDEHWIKHWNVKGDEELAVHEDCIKATAASSLFSWLNAQAHALGHTQYNDIEEPIVSQLVLSNGKQFYFAIAQLSTLLINVEVEGIVNSRINLCYVEGPINLYDNYDRDRRKFGHIAPSGSDDLHPSYKEGINPSVLQRILQMIVRDMPRGSVTENSEILSRFVPISFEDVP